MFQTANSWKTKYVSCTKLGLGCTYASKSPFVKNKIRFTHKTWIRLYLCFNKPIRNNKIRFIHKTMMMLYLFQKAHSWKTKCASCIYYQEPILFGPELLSSRFFPWINWLFTKMLFSSNQLWFILVFTTYTVLYCNWCTVIDQYMSITIALYRLPIYQLNINCLVWCFEQRIKFIFCATVSHFPIDYITNL
jgi:hypothetical protein